jgi:hypothetical protein
MQSPGDRLMEKQEASCGLRARDSNLVSETGEIYYTSLGALSYLISLIMVMHRRVTSHAIRTQNIT